MEKLVKVSLVPQCFPASNCLPNHNDKSLRFQSIKWRVVFSMSL